MLHATPSDSATPVLPEVQNLLHPPPLYVYHNINLTLTAAPPSLAHIAPLPVHSRSRSVPRGDGTISLTTVTI